MKNPVDEVNAIFAQWRRECPHAIASARIGADGSPQVEVLTHRQKENLLSQLPPSLHSISITVLATPSTPAPLGFFSLRAGDSSLFRAPERQILTTDFDAADGPLRGVAEFGDSLLVQLWEGTLGWCDPAELIKGTESDPWTAFRCLEAEEAVSGTTAEKAALVEHARTYLGVPYILGGRGRHRMDCSGLTSRVLRESRNLILPRHSTDQRRCGIRATRATLEEGDLLFARLGKTNVPHVGWVTVEPASGNISVLHASQRAKHVIEEPIDAFFEGYRFMGVRRIVATPNPENGGKL